MAWIRSAAASTLRCRPGRSAAAILLQDSRRPASGKGFTESRDNVVAAFAAAGLTDRRQLG